MSMHADEIEKLIREAIPEAKIVVDDLRGDGNHYAVTVESASFSEMELADRHRIVFSALQGKVGGLLRGLTLTTLAPGEEGGNL